MKQVILVLIGIVFIFKLILAEKYKSILVFETDYGLETEQIGIIDTEQSLFPYIGIKEILMDQDQNIYLQNTKNKNILMFSKDGELLSVIMNEKNFKNITFGTMYHELKREMVYARERPGRGRKIMIDSAQMNYWVTALDSHEIKLKEFQIDLSKYGAKLKENRVQYVTFAGSDRKGNFYLAIEKFKKGQPASVSYKMIKFNPQGEKLSEFSLDQGNRMLLSLEFWITDSEDVCQICAMKEGFKIYRYECLKN